MMAETIPVYIHEFAAAKDIESFPGQVAYRVTFRDLSPLPGDVTGDRRVDLDDLLIVLAANDLDGILLAQGNFGRADPCVFRIAGQVRLIEGGKTRWLVTGHPVVFGQTYAVYVYDATVIEVRYD